MAGTEDSRVFILNSNYMEIIEVNLHEHMQAALQPMVVAITTNHNYQGFIALFRSGELVETVTE